MQLCCKDNLSQLVLLLIPKSRYFINTEVRLAKYQNFDQITQILIKQLKDCGSI